MKKTNKLFMVLALVGALSFSSCVKDTESASVADLRKAKAEELTSIAKLNAIKAENEKIMATAEAAMKNAQAEAAKANAEMIKIEAQIKATQNETAKLELEAKKAELEVIKQKIANELKTTQGQLEIDLARQQAEIIQAQEDLKAAQSNVGAAEKARLQKLLIEYNAAFTDLSNVKQSLFSNKKQLIGLENGLVSLKQSQAEQISNLQMQIMRNELQIATYKKFSNYINSTPQELQTKLNEANARLDEITNKRMSLQDAVNQAENKRFKYGNNPMNLNSFRESKFAEAYKALAGNEPAIFNKNFDDEVTPQPSIIKQMNFTVNGLTNNITIEESYTQYKKVAVNASEVATLLTKYTNTKNANLALQQTAQQAYDAQVPVVAAAKKAWDEAVTANTNPVDIQTKYNTYITEKNKLENLKIQVDAFNNGIENAQKIIDNLKTVSDNTIYAEYTTNLDTYNAKIKELTQAMVDAREAFINYMVTTYFPAQEEIQMLKNLITNGNPSALQMAQNIKNLESQINNLKQQISEISTADKEQQIAMLKAQIAKDEEVLAAAQKKFDTAKAALDAAIK